jgi:hypothetical protein
MHISLLLLKTEMLTLDFSADWEMFTAAVTSPSTQQLLISDLAKWVNETAQNGAMGDLYDVNTAESVALSTSL